MLAIMLSIRQFSSRHKSHVNRKIIMKTSLITILYFIVWLFTLQLMQAQGTLYVSNITQPSSATMAVASDSWIAQAFTTGTNPSGYVLDSIQLLMGTASGNPSGFNVSVYSSTDAVPGNLLGNLTGSPDPSTGGIITYSTLGITMSGVQEYFIVVTATTPSTDGAYYWSYSNHPFSGSQHWGIAGLYYTSPNGMDWSRISGPNSFQMAIYATAVPEPSIISLFILGSGVLICVRNRNKVNSTRQPFSSPLKNGVFSNNCE
jgi:hypothetical protein